MTIILRYYSVRLQYPSFLTEPSFVIGRSTLIFFSLKITWAVKVEICTVLKSEGEMDRTKF